MPANFLARHWPWACMAWGAGIGLQLQQTELWSLWAVLGVLAPALLLLKLPFVACRVLGLCALAWAVTALHALSMPSPLKPELEGRDLDVTGRVLDMVQVRTESLRFRLVVEDARLDGLRVAVPERLALGWYAEASPAALPKLQPGERWRLRLRLKAAHGLRNPGGFDQELWLWTQGIRATGYVRQGPHDPLPLRLEQTWRSPLEWLRQRVRDRLLARRSAAASSSEVDLPGVLAALVTGDQSAIERTEWDVFRATGVAHLMSISGVHVTMLGWLAGLALTWGWRRSALWGRAWALHWPAPWVGAWGALVVAAMYAGFSGWGVPAQRTVCMLATATLLRQSARLWPLPLLLSLVGLVVLTLDPWAALQAGFWLSFVAVGVLIATGRNRAPSWGKGTSMVHSGAHPQEGWRMLWNIPARLLHALRGLLWEQWVVTLALTPISLLFFGQVSMVGLLANLVAIPWVTGVVTPLALAGVSLPGLWDLASWALQPLVSFLSVLSAWPWASLQLPMPPWPLALLATAGGVLMLLPWPRAWRVWGLLLLGPALMWRPGRPMPGQFELLAADVGQGNAVLVRTAHHSLLYDAGPRYGAESDAGDRVLVPLLARWDEKLDVLMLSHSDTDHTGGARAVLASQPQAQLWASLAHDHHLWRQRSGVFCQAGLRWRWDGVDFEVLHPTAAEQAQARKPNAATCVLRIQAMTSSALLAGDIELPQENALLARGLRPVDLLLVPHHGSKTSSGEAFLQTLQPVLSLVQAGYRNRYGHPAASVLERYEALGLRWISTAQCGALHWRSDAPSQWTCERVLGQRYWHHRHTGGSEGASAESEADAAASD